MYRFSDRQLTLIQSYIEASIGLLTGHGLIYSVESDMARWADLMRVAPGSVAVTPSFDPEHSNVHLGNTYWSRIDDRAGRTVGCIAMRLFLTDDIIDEIRSWHLFYDRKPVVAFQTLRLVTPDDVPVVSGRVGYSGGYWLHPDYRGRNLTAIISPLHQAVALRHFDLDWVCALNKDTPKRRAMLTQSYGIPGRFSCFDGYFPPHDADRQYLLTYINRGEMLAQMSAALTGAEEPKPLLATG